METPLVSVIVPAYNAQGTLRRCIDSILSQSYRNLEIILLNDGSKDDALALCRQLAETDPRIWVVDKPNSGVADTRNQGIELAQGEYIQFADSDDYLLPGCTERLVEAAEKHHAALVVTSYRMVVPRKDGGFDTREYSLLPTGTYSQTEYLRQVIHHPSSFYFGVLWNKLYRREVLEQHSIRFPPAFYAEDQQFNLLFLEKAERFTAIEEAGYCYVQNPQSICHTSVKPEDMLEHRRRMYRTYKELCLRMGIYAEMRPQLHGIYISLFESPLPSGPLQKLSDAAARTPARKV